jgi:hypothetical protein
MLFIVIAYDINVSYSTDLHLFVYHICPPLIVTLNYYRFICDSFHFKLFLPKIFTLKDTIYIKYLVSFLFVPHGTL